MPPPMSSVCVRNRLEEVSSYYYLATVLRLQGSANGIIEAQGDRDN